MLLFRHFMSWKVWRRLWQTLFSLTITSYDVSNGLDESLIFNLCQAFFCLKDLNIHKYCMKAEQNSKLGEIWLNCRRVLYKRLHRAKISIYWMQFVYALGSFHWFWCFGFIVIMSFSWTSWHNGLYNQHNVCRLSKFSRIQIGIEIL